MSLPPSTGPLRSIATWSEFQPPKSRRERDEDKLGSQRATHMERRQLILGRLSSVQNLVISSSERPLVSGISQATRITVNKAPALKIQKVPSDPQYFCMIGK